MKMIPSSVGPKTSNAEKKVFFALKQLGMATDAVCFHSLSLPRHAYKFCCELDFLIVSSEGLFALEVKGGGISRDEKGAWASIDGGGVRHVLRESPFKQVEGNFYALLDMLKNHMAGDLVGSITKGWGVIFPDCKFDVHSVEWDDAVIADQICMHTFESWFQNFTRYYSNKRKARVQKISPDLLGRMLSLLRPRFEQIPSLGGALGTVEQTLKSLTEDQCRAVDILTANPRVLCSGGAGTGKTFLAMDLARRALNGENKVLFCCSSRWLKEYLDARLQHPNLQMVDISRLFQLVDRGMEPVDMLVVDEGQDMMNFDDLGVLDHVLKDGLGNGKWSLFCDCNNQVGLLGKWNQEAFDYLMSLGIAKVPLTRNCRNTKPIVNEVVQVTGCNMGEQELGEGPRVSIIRCADHMKQVQALKEALEELFNGGVSKSHITLLSPLDWEQSCVSGLSGSLAKAIRPLDEYSLRSFPMEGFIGFAQIQNFKGLENEAIIITDISAEQYAKPDENIALLYVGLSRARAYLSVHVHD